MGFIDAYHALSLPASWTGGEQPLKLFDEIQQIGIMQARNLRMPSRVHKSLLLIRVSASWR
jgi:hypothetical protein